MSINLSLSVNKDVNVHFSAPVPLEALPTTFVLFALFSFLFLYHGDGLLSTVEISASTSTVDQLLNHQAVETHTVYTTKLHSNYSCELAGVSVLSHITFSMSNALGSESDERRHRRKERQTETERVGLPTQIK